jgi:hypothetical protein
VKRAARFEPFPQHNALEMILQIGADRQIGQRRDSELAQMIGRTDAREHQQLR